MWEMSLKQVNFRNNPIELISPECRIYALVNWVSIG